MDRDNGNENAGNTAGGTGPEVPTVHGGPPQVAPAASTAPTATGSARLPSPGAGGAAP